MDSKSSHCPFATFRSQIRALGTGSDRGKDEGLALVETGIGGVAQYESVEWTPDRHLRRGRLHQTAVGAGGAGEYQKSMLVRRPAMPRH